MPPEPLHQKSQIRLWTNFSWEKQYSLCFHGKSRDLAGKISMIFAPKVFIPISNTKSSLGFYNEPFDIIIFQKRSQNKFWNKSLWKTTITRISPRLKSSSDARGKTKYPLCNSKLSKLKKNLMINNFPKISQQIHRTFYNF